MARSKTGAAFAAAQQGAGNALITTIGAILRGIRGITAHNTATIFAYVAQPAPFWSNLTSSQAVQVHNSAVSLTGVGRSVDLGRARSKREATEEDFRRMREDIPGMQTALAGMQNDPPRFVWAHQRYTPLPQPGNARKPSLQEWWGDLISGGKIPGVAAEADASALYIATVQAAVCTCQDWGACQNSAHQVVQRPVSGGYMLAVKADAQQQRARLGARGTVSRPKSNVDPLTVY